MDKFVSTDTIWVLIGAFLVFSMQPGFAMVETGFTRAKNAANIVMKNVMDMSLGSIVFWILGFGLMFGEDIGGFIGAPDFFVKGDYGALVFSYIRFGKDRISEKIPMKLIWIFIAAALLYGVLRNIPAFSFLAPTVI